MPPLHARGRSAWAALVLGLALGLGPGVPAARAQGGENVFYTSLTRFRIPFTLDVDKRSTRQVLLHASEDLGKTYEVVANATPSDTAFSFQARRDGWYWFIVQTQGNDGRYSPANVTLVAPGLKVCVDTQKPTVSLKAVQPDRGTVGVEWDVKDENLDLATLELHYRAVGARDWVPLNVQQLAYAQFGWDAPGAGPFEVRLRVSDKARNQAEATTTVTPGRARAPAGAGADAGSTKVIYVRQRTFKLNYTIENEGPSKVKEVEVWFTRDTSSWMKYPEKAKPEGPYEVRVSAAGRWGFTLVPRSGVGLGPPPPQTREQPQVWVEVDETPPQVQLHNVVVDSKTDPGEMTVTWRATDAFLRAQPITISYATSLDGEWKVLKGNLENTGSYTCSTKEMPFEFYLKVEALDE